MKHAIVYILLACIFLSSCTSAAPTTKSKQLNIQYSAASIPWLAGLFNCAGGDVIAAEQRGAAFLGPSSADMVIRLGLPGDPNPFSYQIGTDKLLVITNRNNPATTLTADQIHGLFTGQIQNWKTIHGTDAPVDVWVYPAGEDIQGIIVQTMLDGSPVSSSARLANNPEDMLQAIEKDVNAVGIIPSRWKNGNVSGVYTAPGNFPVLAISTTKPQATLANILACMQK